MNGNMQYTHGSLYVTKLNKIEVVMRTHGIDMPVLTLMLDKRTDLNMDSLFLFARDMYYKGFADEVRLIGDGEVVCEWKEVR